MDFSKEANEKKQKKHISKNKKIKNRVGVIIIRILFIAVILSFFAGLGGLLGVVLGIINTAPILNAVDVIPEGYTSIIYEEKTGREIDRIHGEENREYVKLNKIPLHLQKAVIAVEDERFYEHFGIDPKGMIRAFFVNIKNKSLSEGASTLTQQLIKNRILTSEKKIKRKIQEQYLAIELEKKMSKDQILQEYLNTIALGHGLHGVQSAAKRYFNKEVEALTLGESTVIAGITKNPTRFSPIFNPENNRERQITILNKMLEQGYISNAEYEDALAEDVYSRVQTVAEETAEEAHHTYYVDQVITEVATDLQLQKGVTRTQAYNMIFNGGLSIYAAVDMDMQRIVDESYRDDKLFPPKDFELKVIYNLSIEKSGTKEAAHYQKTTLVKNKEASDLYIKQIQAELMEPGDTLLKDKVFLIPQPQSAMVIIDYHNGLVKAISGGRGDKLGDRTYNRATQAKRQPGSAFKVLAAYAPALDLGKYTAATVLDDVPYTIDKYSPTNWYKGYRGLSTIREGIKDSMNILAVKTIVDIGVNTSFDYLQHFGFTTLIDRENRGNKIYSDKNAPLALGGITDGVTPLELTAAYGTIANEGKYIKPSFYTKVLDHSGNILLEHIPTERPVLKETTAFLLTDMMKDVVTGGTGGLARFQKVKMPVAGKTGTTSDDKDLIFAGYTPYYAAAIWLGHDQPKKLIYDKSYHNILWRTVMEKIHEDLPYKDFVIPQGIVTVEICTESGKLPIKGLCDHDPRGSTIRTEYFAKGTEPTEPCDVHIKAGICKHSGLFANEYCPKETTTEKVYIVRPIPYIPSGPNAAYPSDSKYELPKAKEGEYCNIHGPFQSTPALPSKPNTPGSTVPIDPFSTPISPGSSISDTPDSLDQFYWSDGD